MTAPWQHAATPPPCAETCRAVLVRGMSEQGIEVAPTWVPPLVPAFWEPLNLRCPHGVLWFMEPTAEGVRAMIAADADEQ